MLRMLQQAVTGSTANAATGMMSSSSTHGSSHKRDSDILQTVPLLGNATTTSTTTTTTSNHKGGLSRRQFNTNTNNNINNNINNSSSYNDIEMVADQMSHDGDDLSSQGSRKRSSNFYCKEDKPHLYPSAPNSGSVGVPLNVLLEPNSNNNNNAHMILPETVTIPTSSTLIKTASRSASMSSFSSPEMCIHNNNNNNNGSSSSNINHNNILNNNNTISSSSSSNNNNNNSVTTMAGFQLLFGTAGIFLTYLYYGHVQEDLFRYRDPVSGAAFTYVWFLQVVESAVTILIGHLGRKYSHQQLPPAKQVQVQNQTLPLTLFFQSGSCQLMGKALMAMSLAAGLSFPVVVLAKSAKVVPVMLGQLLLGGSSYSPRDYLFAFMIVAGTAMLSMGTETKDASDEGKSTSLGLFLIFASLVMDGVTGGLQKKLKKETAQMTVTTYDFLFYSHTAMWAMALLISIGTGELYRGHAFLIHHMRDVLHLLLASCICSAVGQCFIFYVIATFDPLVCTTVTTTRKMASVIFSLAFKGHTLSKQGIVGLILGISALFIEVQGKVSKHKKSSGNK